MGESLTGASVPKKNASRLGRPGFRSRSLHLCEMKQHPGRYTNMEILFRLGWVGYSPPNTAAHFLGNVLVTFCPTTRCKLLLRRANREPRKLLRQREICNTRQLGPTQCKAPN
jgi:hypothetical protein